ncbi:hypothetical protein DEU56DRAFT_831106 [Suillus clintonianus]|uniref:uncharacterized protein n=1 Tax=Suillus clintonianus TaxID=1904413 RepID=UPI001B86C370|nr:uncharacterized protein DEU56DRAFT_831106 [Suillus clintonianus]KAG2122927.1 hypothetical protein DEU56DRAFT_831106 [Suillus clintonianus]
MTALALPKISQLLFLVYWIKRLLSFSHLQFVISWSWASAWFYGCYAVPYRERLYVYAAKRKQRGIAMGINPSFVMLNQLFKLPSPRILAIGTLIH